MKATLFEQLSQSLREAGKIRRGEMKPSRTINPLKRIKAKERLWRGDLVSHKHRGRGSFECYGADSESCFVRFDDTGESDRVTTSMVRKLKDK